MPNPYMDEFRKTRAEKMRKLDVVPSGFPADKARALAEPAPHKGGDPAIEVREGRILPEGTEARVRALYEPQTGERIPLPAWATRE